MKCHFNCGSINSFFHHNKNLLVIQNINTDSDNYFRILTFSSDHNDCCRIFTGYYLSVILYYHVFTYYPKLRYISNIEYLIPSMNFPIKYWIYLYLPLFLNFYHSFIIQMIIYFCFTNNHHHMKFM